MCFFDQTLWVCGYWKWGHFRGQCNREYRTGETCGLKFINQTINDPDICKLCKDKEKKERKRIKLENDIYRWTMETSPRTASIEKARRDLYEVEQAIAVMTQQHNTRRFGTV
ncbi:hypothetical protein F4777DRAFT_228043 [Nemania sp. FL0916]|nr:hypothetical protein F4777DRAFT_228043 [Nemania sp. FL0916]